MKPIGSRVVSYGVAAAVGVASVIGYILVTGVKLSNERAKYEEEQRLSQASQPTTDAGDPQNVLILLWDTVRADRMSVYGHDRPTTPYLEQLAEESLVFERAVSPAIWTVPSHASLFTGLPASTHGCHALWTWLDGHHVTLAEWLGEKGYETYLFSSNIYVEDKTNLTQGFTTRHYSYKEPWKAPARKAASQKLLAKDRSTEISPGFRSSSSRALGWGKLCLKTRHQSRNGPCYRGSMSGSDKPFFAFVNLMEAQVPVRRAWSLGVRC